MSRTFKWNTFRNFFAATLGAAALLLTMSTSAFAHPTGGVISLASNPVAVGGTLGLTGEKLEKNSNIKLELRGILDNYPVGEVRTDTAGKFQMSIVMPPHVPAGAYTLVAIAADGDVAARADLTVGTLTGAAESGPVTGMPGMSGMGHGTQEMPGMHATDEMMALKRTTSGGEWAFIAAFIIVMFAGGAVLLRKAALMGHG